MNEYELSNLFHSLTGMTIKEYIRKRRLTLAAYDLQQGNERIIDIAIKYGYDSADSFRRAFSRQHKITPSQARSNSAALNIYPPLSFEIKVKGASKMNFKIVDTEDIVVYGISEPCFSTDTSRYDFAKDMWSDECQHIPSRICEGYDGIWYAIWSNSSYTIARDKSNCTKQGLKRIIIPKGKYAVFTTDKGGYAGNELPKLHSEIFDSWLPSSDYMAAADFELEVYHLATDKETRRKTRYYEIWVPIKDKALYERSTDITIRCADKNDAKALADICTNDLGYICNAEMIKSKFDFLDYKREQIFVAQAGSKVVGFVHIELYNIIYCDKGSNILGLAVSADYQKQGIGKQLMTEAQHWAKKNGATFVRLNSGCNRKEAHEFYRHLGYDNEKAQIRFIKML